MSDDDQNDPDDPGRLRQMFEDANARAAAADKELATLKAREVFRDAGLDPSKPLHQAVMRGYDGDLEPDAVRAYVADLGVTEPPPQPKVETPPVGEDEQAALIRIAEAARDTGGPPPQADRRAQLEQQLKDLPRGATIQDYDRLAEEFSRAGGFRTARDIPGT